jgi:hypothetical protein
MKMYKVTIVLALICLLSINVSAQQKQTFSEIGIEFESSLTLKKISDNPATAYTPKMKVYDGLSANGKPYLSVSLAVEENAATKTEKSIVEMIKVMLSPAMTTQQKNGITFYIDTQKSGTNDNTYYLQFVRKNIKYSFTIAGKSGTKAEMEKILNSLAFLK